MEMIASLGQVERSGGRTGRVMVLVCVVAAVAHGCGQLPLSPSGRTQGTGGASLPFGPKQLPAGLFGPPFTGAYVTAESVDTLRWTVPGARAAGVKLIIKLSQGPESLRDEQGRFSLDRWKNNISRLRGFDFAPYVADGTVLGAEIVNTPHDAEKWGGEPVSKDDLDAAAAYAKSIWPSLPVGGGRSDYVAERAPWRYLDFCHSQYHMRKGDVRVWLDRTVAEANAAGVALVLSLNFYAGGMGDAAMTAEEVREFGTLLATDPHPCALTGYKYDDEYLARPGMLEAMAAVAAVASSHPAPPCYLGAVKR